MRGDTWHNDIQVARLRQVAEECGATVRVEEPVKIGGVVHYADLTVRKNGILGLCEPEGGPARVGNDLQKAIALGADYLLISTLDATTAQACRRKLRRLPRPLPKLKVFICPLGAALEILRSLLSAQPAQTATATQQPIKES